MFFRNSSASITFVRDPTNNQTSKPSEKDCLKLESYKAEEVLKFLPRDFIITTNNSTGRFNYQILKETSPVISKFLEENPSNFKYHIDIDDHDNILSKFEQLYLGEKVIFTEEELPVSKKITNALNIKRCPNYMKPESLRYQERENYIKSGLDCGVGIDEINFYSFICNAKNNTFKITTNNNQYMVNQFSVFISQVIREQLLQDPSIKEYKYDFDNENNEFQLICNIFNNRVVNITPTNMYSIKRISEDLQIDLIIPQIDDNINNNEKISKTIDDLQTTRDVNENLFSWLYNINNLTVETVKNSILNSEWIKTEDNIYEMAVFILQVVDTSLNLHSYLIDLIIQLDKESKRSKKLNVLLPFILDRLKHLIGKSLTICSFIYNLYKQGILVKEQLKKILFEKVSKRQDNLILENIFVWFIPELFELEVLTKNSLKERNINQIFIPKFLINVNSGAFKFIKFYLQKDKFEDYEKVRESGKPNDLLTRAILEDDDNKVQLIISNSNIEIDKYQLPYNIFERFIENGQTTLINYAAAHGSVKCFKYLKINHSNIEDLTFYYAVCGGNIEIIRTVEQNLTTDEMLATKKSIKRIVKNRSNDKKINNIEDKSAISNSIMKHRNDLFDWIFENNYSGKDELEKAEVLLIESVGNGNAHSLLEVIDSMITACDYQSLIQVASKNGFYKISKLIFDIMNEKSKELKFDESFTNNSLDIRDRVHNSSSKMKFNDSFICLDNLSIFKLGLKLIKNSNQINAMFIYSIINEYKNIFDYYLDEIFKKNFSLTDVVVFTCLQKALNCSSEYIFNRLIQFLIEINPYIFIQFENIQFLLISAAQSKNFHFFKTIYDITIEHRMILDFERAFIEAMKFNSKEICQFLIDKGLKYQKIVKEISLVGTTSKEIFCMIIDNTSIEMRDNLISWSLSSAIKSKNKELVEFLLSENAPIDDALIDATYTNDLDIIEIVLKYNDDPYFVNKKSKDGTALYIASNQGYLEIVRRLLKIPGIDPNLYEKEDQTPLICSIAKFNIEIMNEILDFYGDKIQSQLWQFDKAIEKVLSSMISNKGNGETNKEKLLLILKRILEIKNVNPNCRGAEHTLLTYACQSNEIEIVKVLLKIDRTDVNAYAPSNGNTPLMIAILNHNIEIAELLINDQRTDINARNYENDTSLTIAVNENLENIVNLLIKNDRFDPNKSLINVAFCFSKGEISKLLLSTKMVDINYRYSRNLNRNSTRNSISTPLYLSPLNNAVQMKDRAKIDLIIQNESFDKVKSLLKNSIFDLVRPTYENIELFKLLIKLNDDDVNIYDDNNSSLLMRSVYNDDSSFINEILENKNFDSKKSNLVEAFDLSFKLNRHYDLLFEFDQNHDHLIDLNELMPNGCSYFTSIKNEFSTKVDFLLQNGADPNIPDKDGIYPLEYAFYISEKQFISSLLNTGKIDLTKQIEIKNIRIISKCEFDENSQKKISKSTFSKDINPLIKSNSKSATYIHLAVLSQPQILQLFLSNGKFDINAKDNEGETPLMFACRLKLVKNISLLLEYKDQDIDINLCNNKGENALKILEDQPKSVSRLESMQLLIGKMNQNKLKQKTPNDKNDSSPFSAAKKKFSFAKKRQALSKSDTSDDSIEITESFDKKSFSNQNKIKSTNIKSEKTGTEKDSSKPDPSSDSNNNNDSSESNNKKDEENSMDQQKDIKKEKKLNKK